MESKSKKKRTRSNQSLPCWGSWSLCSSVHCICNFNLLCFRGSIMINGIPSTLLYFTLLTLLYFTLLSWLHYDQWNTLSCAVCTLISTTSSRHTLESRRLSLSLSLSLESLSISNATPVGRPLVLLARSLFLLSPQPTLDASPHLPRPPLHSHFITFCLIVDPSSVALNWDSAGPTGLAPSLTFDV
jgi:hypothetical protein